VTSKRIDVTSTRQAAARLGVALRNVQLWVEQGSLQPWKTVGGHRRVDVDSVERMIAKRAESQGDRGRATPLRLHGQIPAALASVIPAQPRYEIR
jgi:excisionase family DNA binding protein